MKITFLGTTVLLFDDGKDQVMFDAHITRPSMFKCFLSRIRTDEQAVDGIINRFGIDRLRAIFVSHSHHDHVMDAPYFSDRCGADIYGSPSTLNVARGGNVPEERLHSYEEQMEYKVGDFEITVMHSKHTKPGWYNNDIGQTIDDPLRQPARRKDYKEGNSFEFLVKNGGRSYLIRASFNYIEGLLNDVRADVAFLGITGLAKAPAEMRERFFYETIDKVRPRAVIPLHWDNFFRPLDKPVKGFPGFIDDTEKSFDILKTECEKRGIRYVFVDPLETVEF